MKTTKAPVTPVSALYALQGSYAEADTQVIVTEILRGLRYAHERSYVHRDIKVSVEMKTLGCWFLG